MVAKVKAKIKSHKEEPLNVDLADGKTINLQPGESTEADLNGAEIGYVGAKLDAQAKDRLIRGTGGSVTSEERATSDANPPPKSKKALLRIEAACYGINASNMDYGETQAALKAAITAGVERRPRKDA